ncbi:MAG: hypothetical protein JJE05_04590 [Actinobacteria bacterium]|nr:hypothetical protein [Actinomycetota bacterium]
MKQMKRSLLTPLATVAGLAFIGGVMLVATQANSDPVGRHYDAYNRVLTIGLVLVALTAVWMSVRVKRLSLAGARAIQAVAIGSGLMLVGNVLEFWGSLLTGSETQKTAERLGHADAFWGSDIGWFAFLIGAIVLTVALIVVARAARRWGATRSQRWAIGTSGVMQSAATGLWVVSPIAAAIPAAAFAFGWLSLATIVDRVEEPIAVPADPPDAATVLP